MSLRRALFLAIVLLCAGCDGPQRTIDQLRGEIAEYKANPSDDRQEAIEVNFARLDAQIEALEEKGKTADAAALQSSAANLQADYRAARMVRTMKEAQKAIQGIGDAFKEAGQSIGDAFRNEATPTPAP